MKEEGKQPAQGSPTLKVCIPYTLYLYPIVLHIVLYLALVLLAHVSSICCPTPPRLPLDLLHRLAEASGSCGDQVHRAGLA